ncbi:MAG: hypothetical protein KGI54_18060 [Pseudomonadota bacterium]|nr:hypothetical protein [Pseudomonadota bacterium]
MPHIIRVMDHREKLLRIFNAYCGATRTSEARVSTIVLNGGHRIGSIQAGASFTVRTYERALEWFSANWPENAVWPDGVERPIHTEDAA